MFHTNPETGEVSRCKATKGKCRFGSVGEHFTSADEARKAYESKMNAEHLISSINSVAAARAVSEFRDSELGGEFHPTFTISDDGETFEGVVNSGFRMKGERYSKGDRVTFDRYQNIVGKNLENAQESAHNTDRKSLSAEVKHALKSVSSYAMGRKLEPHIQRELNADLSEAYANVDATQGSFKVAEDLKKEHQALMASKGKVRYDSDSVGEFVAFAYVSPKLATAAAELEGDLIDRGWFTRAAADQDPLSFPKIFTEAVEGSNNAESSHALAESFMKTAIKHGWDISPVEAMEDLQPAAERIHGGLTANREELQKELAVVKADRVEPAFQESFSSIQLENAVEDLEGSVTQIASQLHENWRRERNYEPRMKRLEDGSEIDIAGVKYEDLPEQWQRENRAAAEDALNTLHVGRLRGWSKDQLGDAIHRSWLERNGEWAPDEQKLPYKELSSQEQLKDLTVLEAAAAVIARYPKD